MIVKRYISMLWILGSLLICNCALKEKVSRDKPQAPPNLIVILVDDLGYADVGFNGCKDIPTPNIDRIADGGVVFSNGYVSYAVCGPSRAGLITGRYQNRFGFNRNPLFAPNDPSMGLPLDELTIAEVLQQANYKSAAIGKWHLGAHTSQKPLKRGFTDFYGFLTGGHRYFPEEWTIQNEFEVKSQFDAYRTKLLRNNERVEETEYLTDALSREAVHYIENYKEDPFFIYLAYNAPHAPLQAPMNYLNRFNDIQDEKRKIYAAMVSAVDDGVGLVLKTLEDLDLTENTLVVFLSDNGGPEKSNASDNGALRGQKGDLWEGGVRVPFAMQWPSKIKAGSVYSKPVISLDILATIVGQNKQSIALDKPLDGVDLIPFLTEDQSGDPHKMLFWQKNDSPNLAVVHGNSKLVSNHNGIGLYDLERDIGESVDLQNVEAKLELKSAFNVWNSEMEPPAFMGLRQNKEYNILHPNRFGKHQ